MSIGKITTQVITRVIEKIKITGIYVLFSEKETFFCLLVFHEMSRKVGI